MARHVTCRDAAILPELEDKRPLRGHRECVAIGPISDISSLDLQQTD